MLSLHPDSVHVWRITLDRSDENRSNFAVLLSADEAERAARFRFPIHRNRFIVGRGFLRLILGRYLGTSPAQLRFTYGAQGKPELVGEVLQFNLSHSEGLALLAVSRSRTVGIDVELIARDSDLEGMARHICSNRELAALERVSPEERPSAFFNAWTRKEAFVKAAGKGFSLPVNQVEVSLEPGAPARLLAVPVGEGPVSRWSMAALEPQSGFAGALVVDGQGWSLEFFKAPCMDSREWLTDKAGANVPE